MIKYMIGLLMFLFSALVSASVTYQCFGVTGIELVGKSGVVTTAKFEMDDAEIIYEFEYSADNKSLTLSIKNPAVIAPVNTSHSLTVIESSIDRVVASNNIRGDVWVYSLFTKQPSVVFTHTSWSSRFGETKATTYYSSCEVKD